MKKMILGFLLLALPAVGLSQITSQPSPSCGLPAIAVPVGSSVILNWIAPTKYTDGTAITGTITYNLYNVTGVNPVLLSGGLTGLTTTRSNLSAGTPCYSLTAVVGGVESALTNTVSIWVAEIPGAPGTLTCTVTLPQGQTSSATVSCTTK